MMDSTAAWIVLGSPSMRVARNHGKPRPMQISNTLEPMALETAMSPSPSFATAMEPSASGTDVPIARKVMPMMKDEMPHAQPIFSMSTTMKYDRIVIHTSEMVNVTRYIFW